MNLPIAFGKYLLIEHIATGGMAEVFKAKSFGFGGFEKIVAIKKIHPHLSIDQEFVNMFIDEANIASNLTHQNIVQIFDLGKIEDSYFIAMEYIDGITLEKFIEMELPPIEKILLSCYIIRETARALNYAHRKKTSDGKPLHIVHRDISPQNILLSGEGSVKLTDFGIAKALLRVSKTEPGITKGKYPYMSPEQVMGKPIDHRSDIFSLSVLFYEMLTGKPAFWGETEFEIMESIKKCEYQLPRKLNKLIPEELEQILIKGMQKSPAQRFDSAEEIALCLSEFLSKNNYTEPQNSLKKIVKKIIGENIEEFDNRLNSSTVVLKPTKPNRIKRLLMPGIAGAFTIFIIIAYQYHYSKSTVRNETHGTIVHHENTHNPSVIQEDRENSQTIELVNEEKVNSKLNINSIPWSYVYLDGNKIGETPLSGITISPGEHKLTFKNPGLNLRVTRVINVGNGEEKTILEHLRK